MAEGGGVEPQALPRCPRAGFRDQLPPAQRHLPFDLAEGARIELAQPCLGAGLGLANRRFTAHPTFRTRRMIGIDCGASGVDSAFVFAWQGGLYWKRWCPDQDLNPESLASKASAFTIFAIGASGGASWNRTKWAETTGLQPVPAPYRTTAPAGGPTEIRTQNFLLLRQARLPITPSARNYSPSRYRNRKVVWVAGFEPAASAFRGRPSTGLTLHPESVGRGRRDITEASMP